MLNILRASLRTGRVTTGYPDAPDNPPGRGAPELDQQRCDGMGACASACPAGAIAVSRPGGDIWEWQLDLARCVFCGLCEEACPKGAIQMTDRCELAARSREDLRISAGLGPRAGGPVEENQAGRRPPLERSLDSRTEGDLFGSRLRRSLKRSLHIRHLAAGSDNSCDWEIAHLLSPIYDIQRLGIDFVASPRHADLLMVTGAVTRNLEPALYATYQAMPAPRLVAAVGSEACGGGILAGSYCVAGGVDHCLPVDVYIPGDPPRPQALIQGLLLVLDRLEKRPER